MRILHITPHLGGGVGRAHAALCGADPRVAERHYLLLEAPRDTRHVDEIEQTGATVTTAPDRSEIARPIEAADIVQFDWWNHPLMCGLLAGPPLPPMRSVLWSHVSGLFAPFIPAGLVTKADRFVFTSACSRGAPNLAALGEGVLAGTAVINSGFGHAASEAMAERARNGVAYLGTVDFSKMSPAMFEVIDRLDRDTIIDFWGGVAASGAVREAVAAMRHPERVRLNGHTADPLAALSPASVFLYLLQPQHFGTAENALVEAMSLGLAPIVFGNPCEREIVRHGETGLVAASVEEAVLYLGRLLDNPEEALRLGEAARREVLETKAPARSLAAFRALWTDMMQAEKRVPDFASAFGPTPRHWYQSLQGAECGSAAHPASAAASKGTLAHFLAHYPDLDTVPEVSARS